jgi:type IV pilus assembly protein PilW
MLRYTNKPLMSSERGLTLVEVLIVTVIMGVVLTGLIVVFISGQYQYGIRDATIRMQQQARLAMTILEHDLKMTGYGLMDLGNLKINKYQSGASVPVLMGVIEAEDGGSGGGPDAITISFQNPNIDTDVEQNVVVTKDCLSSKENTISVSSIDDFKVGDLFLIYDPVDLAKPASLLQVSVVPSSDKMLKQTNNIYNPPNTFELFPPGGYPLGSKIINYSTFDIWRVRFSVQNGSLIREEWHAPLAPPRRRLVAGGIEDLQVRYLFRDGAWLDAPVNGDANHDIDNVQAIRTGIITRTANPDMKFDSAEQFQLTGADGNGRVYSGGHYRRMIMRTTISLRNLAMRTAP